MVIALRDIEKIIREVDGTMSIEGMPITGDDKDRIRNCLRNKKKYDEAITALIKKHTVRVPKGNNYIGVS